MANKKITELDAATTLASTDVVPVVDVSADETKKITATNLFRTLPDGTAAAPALAFSSSQANGVYLAGTDTVGISTGGTQRFTVDGSGNVTISGGLTVEGQTTTVESTIVTIDDKNIELGSVATPTNTTADGGGITLKGATDKTIKWINSTGYWTFNTGIEVGGNIQIDDNSQVRIGTDADLKLYHSGTGSVISNSTGGFVISNSADDDDIVMQTDNGSGGVTTYLRCDGSIGSVRLHHYGTEKLRTVSTGIDVFGEVECDSLDVDSGQLTFDATNNRLNLADNVELRLGTGSDLRIYHNGTNTHISNTTGGLYIDQNLDDGDIILRSDDGSGSVTNYIACDGSAGEVRLYHYGSEKLNTKSDGIDVAGEVQCDSLDVDGVADITGELNLHANLSLQDNDRINVGVGDDLQLFHDGSNSYVKEAGTGSLIIETTGGNIDLKHGTEYLARFKNDAEVELYYDNSLKLETKSDGIDVTGEVQCDSLDVDGSADFTGDVAFRGGAGAVEIAANSDIRLISGSWTGDYGAKIQHHSNTLYIQGGSSGIIFRDPNGTDRARFDANGHFHPNGSNNYDLGTSSNQWRNAFFDGTVNADGLDVDGAGDISGALQIGSTSSANSSVIVRSTTSGDGGYYFNDGSNAGAIIYNHASNYMKFRVNGSDAGQFDSSGHLMVGTTTEGHVNADNLTVADAGHSGITIRSGTTHQGAIFFSDATSGAAEYDGFVNYQHSTRTLRLGSATVTRFSINSNGAWGLEGDSNYGTSGQVLTSNGNDSPTWQNQATAGGSNAISMNDNVKINFGAGNDLQIYHDGNNSFIKDTGTGRLTIATSQLQLTNAADSEVMIRADQDGEVNLYHNGVGKLATKATGIDVTGEVQCDSLDVDGSGDITGTLTLHDHLDMQDDDFILMGSGDDFKLHHNGANSHIQNYTGGLYIDQHLNDGNLVLRSDNGSGGLADYVTCQGSSGEVFLYHYGTQKFKTKSDGVDVTGEVQCDSLDVDGSADISGSATVHGQFNIGGELGLMGTSDGNKYIDARLGNGSLYIRGTSGGDANHETLAQFTRNGAVALYHNNSQKFTTIATGVNFPERVGINQAAPAARLGIENGNSNIYTILARSAHNTAIGIFQIHTDNGYTGDGFKFHHTRGQTSAMNFAAYDSNHGGTADREFTMRGDGQMFADGNFNSGGADYAEYFETTTGSPIPVGTTVVLENNKVRAATSEDSVSAIIGVVRPKEPGKTTASVGNAAWSRWNEKYLTDDFDRYILDEHTVYRWTETVDDGDDIEHSYASHQIPDGVTIPSDAVSETHDEKGNRYTHYRLNPDFNPDITYVSREERDEWVIVGLVGQVKVLDGQPTNDRWIKMRDVSDTVEQWFIR